MTDTGLMASRRMRRAMQAVVGLSIAGGCLWLTAGHLEALTADTLRGKITDQTAVQTGLAVCCCLISFWAVGRYDTVAHRHLGTGVDVHRARISGTVAVALAQTLGLGVFTGALARWRMLPELSLPTAMRLSGFVSLSFIIGWVFVTALVCVLFGAPGWARLASIVVLVLLPFSLAALFWFPIVTLGMLSLQMPSLPACGAILFWTAVDTTAAAAALWLLIPMPDLAFAPFLSVFLLALGAGLLTGTPGGVGPFELALLSLLPTIPVVDLMAGVVVFRVLYYAGPAVLAMVAMRWPLRHRAPPAPPPLPALAVSPRAEVAVIRQNGGWIMPFTQGAVPSGRPVRR